MVFLVPRDPFEKRRIIIETLGLLISVPVLLSALHGGFNYYSRDENLPRESRHTAVATAEETPTVKKNIPEPNIDAEAYLVRLFGDIRPLLSRRPEKRLAPASLTKILTAAVAREELEATDKIRLSNDSKLRAEPKLSAAPAGEIFFRDDAIRLALINSANDAALALAEAAGENKGGGTFEDRIKTFVDLMNNRARVLGMRNSSFRNPTGLDEESHLSTVENLADLAEYAWYNHRQIWEISRNIETKIYSVSGREYSLFNTNILLKEFPAILGGKTGFTDEAKGALLLIYPVRPRGAAAIIILGSEDRFEDGRKLIQWLEESF